jgi:hypothetical protein
MYRWWNVQRVTYLYISVTLCKVNRQSISASENGENFLDQLKEKYRTLCSNRHEHRKSALPFVTSKRIKAPQLSAPLCLTLFSGVIVTVVKNLVRSHGVGLWCKWGVVVTSNQPATTNHLLRAGTYEEYRHTDHDFYFMSIRSGWGYGTLLVTMMLMRIRIQLSTFADPETHISKM